jgi:hypothetical protein
MKMKKLILLLSLTFCLDAFSQIEKPITKGNIMLEGGASIQSNNVQPSFESTTSTGLFTISFTPGCSYFIHDNFALGLNTNVSYYKGSEKYYSVGVGPTIRYYFKNGLFIKAESMIAFMGRINSYNRAKATNISLIPGIGYALFLNQKVALEPCFSYMYILQHDTYQNINISNFLLELKFSIFL